MKRFFSVLFAICMLCSLVSPAYVMESTSMCQKGTIDFSNIEDDPIHERTDVIRGNGSAVCR